MTQPSESDSIEEKYSIFFQNFRWLVWVPVFITSMLIGIKYLGPKTYEIKKVLLFSLPHNSSQTFNKDSSRLAKSYLLVAKTNPLLKDLIVEQKLKDPDTGETLSTQKLSGWLNVNQTLRKGILRENSDHILIFSIKNKYPYGMDRLLQNWIDKTSQWIRNLETQEWQSAIEKSKKQHNEYEKKLIHAEKQLAQLQRRQSPELLAVRYQAKWENLTQARNPVARLQDNPINIPKKTKTKQIEDLESDLKSLQRQMLSADSKISKKENEVNILRELLGLSYQELEHIRSTPLIKQNPFSMLDQKSHPTDAISIPYLQLAGLALFFSVVLTSLGIQIKEFLKTLSLQKRHQHKPLIPHINTVLIGGKSKKKVSTKT